MLSVVSNTVLIVHTFKSRLDFQKIFNNTEIFATDASFFWIVAVFEHLVIILKLVLSSFMNDVPSWVRQLRKHEEARMRRIMLLKNEE